MFKQKKQGAKPCRPMQTLFSAWIDGALAGTAERYMRWHVAHCPQCADAAPFFRRLHDRLQRLGGEEAEQQLSQDRWSRIEAAWDNADQAKN